MWVLLHEIHGVFETDGGQQVTSVSQRLGFEIYEHVLDVLDLLWVLENVIEQYTLHLEVSEVAQVAGRQHRLLGLEVPQHEKSILLHEGTETWVVGGPYD